MTRACRPGVSFLIAFGCAGCTSVQSALDPHGTIASELLRLIELIAFVCALVWLSVVVFLVIALMQQRRATDPAQPPLALEAATERRMGVAVTAALIGTVLIITAFTALSFATTRRLSLAEGNPIIIELRGYQWWWEVTYPDPHPDRIVVTANEIHIPVDHPVKIKLSAADVIHSFWVPSLAGKQDLIPGRDNTITLNAKRPGIYRGQCAEFCGFQHAHMALLVVAQSEAEYDAWRNAQLAASRPPSDAEQTRGRDVFEAKACATCHTLRGTNAAGKLGPDLTHVASRMSIAAGVLETTRGSLAAWIADPQTLKPGNNMPQVSLSADELNAVSSYMASLQ
jgi:cytochrome c oxidase subunit II